MRGSRPAQSARPTQHCARRNWPGSSAPRRSSAISSGCPPRSCCRSPARSTASSRRRRAPSTTSCAGPACRRPWCVQRTAPARSPQGLVVRRAEPDSEGGPILVLASLDRMAVAPDPPGPAGMVVADDLPSPPPIVETRPRSPPIRSSFGCSTACGPR